MALFRRQPQDSAAAPELPGLTPAEGQAFMADLEAVLDARGGGWRVDDDTLLLEGHTKEYGLTNVARQWRQSVPGIRRGLLRDRLAAIDEQHGSPEIAPADTAALTRPQLWAMEAVEELGDVLIAREVTEDLAAVLSLDLPTAVHAVRPEDVAAAGLPEDALWQRALAQLDDGEPIERTVLDGDELVVVLVSDSHFLASRLLALEDLVGAVPPHGALVGVPHRHMLVLHAIYDATVLEAMNLMAPFVVQHFEDGPGSLSPHLYWWHDGGELERLVVDDDEGSITPPDGFVALLEALTEE